MSETPSHRRHKGREAYDADINPSDICPYKIVSYQEDWLEGWAEAEHEPKPLDDECSHVCGQNHIYGYSSVWNRLVYGLADKERCISDGQVDESMYPFTLFKFCPMCGTDLDR